MINCQGKHGRLIWMVTRLVSGGHRTDAYQRAGKSRTARPFSVITITRRPYHFRTSRLVATCNATSVSTDLPESDSSGPSPSRHGAPGMHACSRIYSLLPEPRPSQCQSLPEQGRHDATGGALRRLKPLTCANCMASKLAYRSFHVRLRSQRSTRRSHRRSRAPHPGRAPGFSRTGVEIPPCTPEQLAGGRFGAVYRV